MFLQPHRPLQGGIGPNVHELMVFEDCDTWHSTGQRIVLTNIRAVLIQTIINVVNCIMSKLIYADYKKLSRKRESRLGSAAAAAACCPLEPIT